MGFRSTFPTVAIGLVLSTAAFAQNAPDGAAPPPPLGGQAQGPIGFNSQIPSVTQSSRIRAFNAGPEGQVRSLYLQNGSVVDVSPDLGRQLSTQAHKGARVRVTGSHSNVNGQQIIMANQITLNLQAYTARFLGEPDGHAGIGPDGARREGPDGNPGTPPPPPPSARLNGPGEAWGPRPGRGLVPPPPPSGPDAQRGARAQGGPPPPPLGQGAPLAGSQSGPTPPPPTRGDPPVQPGSDTQTPPPPGTPGQAKPNQPATPDTNNPAPAPSL